MRRTDRELKIGPPRSEVLSQRYRVTADIDGQPVWFEASIPLVPAPEAFAGLFWIPALHARRPLVVEAELDSHWLANTRRTLPILHQWWDYSRQSPLIGDAAAEGSELLCGPDEPTGTEVPIGQSPSESATGAADTCGQATSASHFDESGRHRSTGLCFSCGIDSFYSLLQGTHRVDALIFAHGFDIPPDDWQRMRHLEHSLEEVAAATSKRLIIVRTNVRTHHFFKSVSWERTHGAALASLGHVLSDTLGQLVIASSYRYDDEHPWGSNWRLDPLWSSGRMTVLHDDATLGRQGKTRQIAGHELVQRHLQVCWSRRSATGNCGECEKCIRMMVTLASLTRLEDFTVFPRSLPLPQLIDALAPLSPHLHPIWALLRQEPLPGPIADAADRLLAQRPGRFSCGPLVARNAPPH